MINEFSVINTFAASSISPRAGSVTIIMKRFYSTFYPHVIKLISYPSFSEQEVPVHGSGSDFTALEGFLWAFPRGLGSCSPAFPGELWEQDLLPGDCADAPFFSSCHSGYVGARCEHADLLAVVASSQKKQAITALVVVSIVALAGLIITCVLIQ